MLPGAQRTARWLRLERWLGVKAAPLTVGAILFAATVALPPLWPLAGLALVQAALPWPTRIEVEIQDPIWPRAGERVDAIAARVERVLHAALHRMAERRRTPWG